MDKNNRDKKVVEIVVIGNVVGKNALIKRYITNEFLDESLPTVCDTFRTEFNGKIEGKQRAVQLQLWDSGYSYERLRPLAYPGADIIILVLVVDSQTSCGKLKKL